MNKKLILIFPQDEYEQFCDIVDQETHICKAHKNLIKQLCYKCIEAAAIYNKENKD